MPQVHKRAHGARRSRPRPSRPAPRPATPRRNGRWWRRGRRWRGPAAPPPPDAGVADAARGDDGHGHRVGDGAGQCEVEAVLHAVAVHRGEQDLARPLLDRAAGMRRARRRRSRVRPPCVKISQRPGATCLASIAATMHCVPKARRGGDDGRVAHGGGIDRDLVGAGEQQGAGVGDLSDAAADRQRHETLVGGAAHDIEQRAAIFMAGGDVEKADFVGTGGIVGARRLHRVARIAQRDEVDRP